MTRLSVALLIFLAGTFAGAQDIPLEIKGGDTKIVQVDTVVVVKSPLTVVSNFPFTVHAPSGHALYFWSVPSGITSLDKGDRLEITSAPKGRLTIGVKIVAADWDQKKFLTKFGSVSFAVGDGAPVPVPDPIDPPKPMDPVKPAPISEPGLRVLIIYETLETSTAIQDIVSGDKVRSYMNAKGVKGGFMALDKDAPRDALPTWVQAAGKRRPDNVLPWILISNHPLGGFEGPLPGTVTETLNLIKKYGD